MLTVGFLLLGLIIYPYVSPSANSTFSGDPYPYDASAVFLPDSPTASLGESVTFTVEYWTSFNIVNVPQFAWYVDGVFVSGNEHLDSYYSGSDSYVYQATEAGSHEVAVHVWVQSDNYDEFLHCYTNVNVGGAQPTPSPTVTPTPSPTQTPTWTPNPSLLPTPTPSSPFDGIFNGEGSLIQNESFKIAASILSFPLIAIGCVTVFLTKNKR
jgi:hypothetical protein